MKCLAIDIGGTKMSAAIITAGVLSGYRKIDTPKDYQPASFTNAIIELITPLASECDIVGISTTGIVRDGKLYSMSKSTLGELTGFDLVAVVKNITQTEVIALNDAQAAAYAEGKVAKTKNNAYVTVSTGVGGGIVLNGNLLKSDNGLAGHIGHIVVDKDGPLCGCGRSGCVEAIASGTAIAKLASVAMGEHVSAKDVFYAMARGNVIATEIVHNAARAVASMIVDLRMSVAIDEVSVGGSVGLAPTFVDLINNYISKEPGLCQVDVHPAHYNNDACMIGAAQFAVDQVNNA